MMNAIVMDCKYVLMKNKLKKECTLPAYIKVKVASGIQEDY